VISWTVFQNLPGGAERNFETLCRSLIFLQYGRFGALAALANQPGVEFHLRLNSDCSLGTAGRWFGWQCRWYQQSGVEPLGSARRKKIEDSLRKTEENLPGLTDWVLWTRYPLAKEDQDWFYALKTSLSLALWTSENVESLLSVDAEILRQTYFGELVLTPTSLAHQHELSTAQIKTRWLPEVHQTVDAERALRRMLGEAESWSELSVIADSLRTAFTEIKAEPRVNTGRFSSSGKNLLNLITDFAELLESIFQLLGQGDFELLRQALVRRPLTVSREMGEVPHQLRNARLACGLAATNAIADIRLGIQLLNEINAFLGTGLVGVVADAGGGKTQLAAQLTAENNDRPAGILLFGRQLHSGKTLDDLAKEIVIQGTPVSTVEALVAALDAAGQRAKRRLPLVFDGLNEAEDPREWKGPLATLNLRLKRFANVLVICTVRTGARRLSEPRWRHFSIEETPARLDFAKQALPEGVTQIELPDFGADTLAAIRKYFTYFRINIGEAELPLELFAHPLTLRIYCEVTNPERKHPVTIDAFPGSLTSLFEEYIDKAISRISDLAPRHRRYFDQDIRRALDILGMAFWDERTRELPQDKIRIAIADNDRPWNESIVHLLEQEGVILRIPGAVPGNENIIPVYDALGGYLIANAILTRLGRNQFEPWLQEPLTLEMLTIGTTKSHPLASDIFRALVGLVPRRLHRQQLWQLLAEPLRNVALRMAASLEAKYLDAATVDALAQLVRDATPGSKALFSRLFRTRAILGHPLNAEFFDSVLRSMPVGLRDLHWTEWVRKNADAIQKNVQQIEERWRKNGSVRTPTDRLRAKWMKWLLTTTVLNLRDRVTRALYWFGRGDAQALFEETTHASDINDPSVYERMLAASYGVAMAEHCNPHNPAFAKNVLPQQAKRVFDLMFRENAPSRTTHVLTREYGRRFIELAILHSRRLFTAEEISTTRPPYKDGGRISWEEAKEEKEESKAASPLRMDFENYTLGRLVEGRANYDFDNEKYRLVRAQVLWRIRQLGWTSDNFDAIDRDIESQRYRYGYRSNDYYKTDRYAKKYGVTAYLELQGWLQDQGLLSRRNDFGRTWDVDIDPSFPSLTVQHKLISSDFLGSARLSLKHWIKRGPVPDLIPYLKQDSLLGEVGPWVALDGFVIQQDEARGRRLFAFVRSFLVPADQEKAFVKCLRKQSLGGRWLPEKLAVLYTFAGEVPWCDTFPNTPWTEMRFVVGERKVTVKRRQAFFYLDGKITNLSDLDVISLQLFGPRPGLEQSSLTPTEISRLVKQHQMVEVQETRQDLRKFNVIMPVWDIGWEGRTVENVSHSGDVLAKRLAKTAKLVHLPQTHDLQTKEGVRATYAIAAGDQDYNNSQQVFYIREDILRSLLQKLGLKLVWAVWGERELSYGQMERARPGGDLAGLSYGNFQVIRPFP